MRVLARLAGLGDDRVRDLVRVLEQPLLRALEDPAAALVAERLPGGLRRAGAGDDRRDLVRRRDRDLADRLAGRRVLDGDRGHASEPSLVGLSSRLVALLAVACGATVANLYYAQPLLDTIARALARVRRHRGPARHRDPARLRRRAAVHRPARRPAAAPHARRRACCALDAARAGRRRRRASLRRARRRAGARRRHQLSPPRSSCPFASTLAADDERGRVVGRVMSGLLLGILLARTISRLRRRARRLAADLRARRRRDARPRARAAARAAASRRRRRTCPTRGCCAASARSSARSPCCAAGWRSASSRWRASAGCGPSISFLLASEYGYGEAVIGLFSLAGPGRRGDRVASPGRPPTAGHVRRRHARRGGAGPRRLGPARARRRARCRADRRASSCSTSASRPTQILNQSVIYRLRPEARSRLTTAYMTAYFAGRCPAPRAPRSRGSEAAGAR